MSKSVAIIDPEILTSDIFSWFFKKNNFKCRNYTHLDDFLSDKKNSKINDCVILGSNYPNGLIIPHVLKIDDLLPNTPKLIIKYTLHSTEVDRLIRIGVKGILHDRRSADHLLMVLDLVISGGIYVDSEINIKTLEMPPSLKKGSVIDIFYFIGCGKSNSEISKILGLSINTVKLYILDIFKTLRLRNRTEVAMLSYDLFRGRENLVNTLKCVEISD